MVLNRRKVIGSALAVFTTSIAGCGEAESDEGGGGNNNEEGSSLPAPKLVRHDVGIGAAGGYELTAIIKNETDQLLTRAVGEVSIFNDNKRLARGRAAIIDLSAGNTAEETALLEDFSPEDITHYTIKMTGETEDYEETDSEVLEFEGSNFRQKLTKSDTE